MTISSLATAGGTLVLAVATFSSVRSANRSARVAELSLLTGMRPVLTPSREDDPVQHVRFGDGVIVGAPGHGGAAAVRDGQVFLALSLRNGGSGLGVIHGWRARAREQRVEGAPPLEEFIRQQVDIYIPAGDAGYWLGRLRPEQEGFDQVRTAIERQEGVQIDLLYGDHEGGQRTIIRFVLSVWADEDETAVAGNLRATVLRYWNIDRTDPR